MAKVESGIFRNGKNQGKYVYESHMGWLYTNSKPLPFEWLHCKTCGDTDQLIGYFTSRDEARRALLMHGFYSRQYINDFLDEEFPKEVNR